MNNLPSDFISPALQMEHRLERIETRLAALEAPAPASVDTPFSLDEHLLNFFGRTLSADEKPHRDGWTGDMLMDPDGTFYRPLLAGEEIIPGDHYAGEAKMWTAHTSSYFPVSGSLYFHRTRQPLPPLQDVAEAKPSAWQGNNLVDRTVPATKNDEFGPQTVTVNNPPSCHSSPPENYGVTHPIHCAKEPGHTGMCQSGFFSWTNPNEDAAGMGGRSSGIVGET